MAPRERGTILFTGATASLRGGSGYSGFAGAKAGLRMLAQSMARELQPKNIHVAHVVIDGPIDTEFVHSGDYTQIRQTAELLRGLIGEGAYVQRGDKRQPVSDFAEAMRWLLAEVEKSVTLQRYKGLGEMNPEQLWETTMDVSARRLLRVQIEDGIAADEIFTKLMGDEVEPRRAFIENNALGVRNLDV